MQEFFDLQHLGRLDAGVLLHAVEAGAPNFQVCHSRRVFIGHPESQVARRFVEQGGIGTTEFCIKISNRLQAG